MLKSINSAQYIEVYYIPYSVVYSIYHICMHVYGMYIFGTYNILWYIIYHILCYMKVYYILLYIKVLHICKQSKTSEPQGLSAVQINP